MKYLGSNCEFEQERNLDLLHACRQEMALATHIHMRDIYRRAAERPARRFWVSEERAAIVIGRMLRGDSLQEMRPLKREMFQEIFRRAKEILNRHPGFNISHVALLVVHQPAPKFYLTPGSVKTILHRFRQKRRHPKKPSP